MAWRAVASGPRCTQPRLGSVDLRLNMDNLPNDTVCCRIDIPSTVINLLYHILHQSTFIQQILLSKAMYNRCSPKIISTTTELIHIKYELSTAIKIKYRTHGKQAKSLRNNMCNYSTKVNTSATCDSPRLKYKVWQGGQKIRTGDRHAIIDYGTYAGE